MWSCQGWSATKPGEISSLFHLRPAINKRTVCWERKCSTGPVRMEPWCYRHSPQSLGLPCPCPNSLFRIVVGCLKSCLTFCLTSARKHSSADITNQICCQIFLLPIQLTARSQAFHLFLIESILTLVSLSSWLWTKFLVIIFMLEGWSRILPFPCPVMPHAGMSKKKHKLTEANWHCNWL